ncbi:MAG: sulfite exporter TauE/SafE family protein [Ignavibacteriaceae bacterium]|nr:sulfite exporter TauE/SafE family protein [Ignavibacteriaceae bacterium]
MPADSLLLALGSGLLLGLAGSLHCVGMCGPLVLGFSARNTQKGQGLSHSIYYSLGRIFTYSLMGLVLGYFGAGIRLTGYQGIVSVIIGSVLLLSVLLPAAFKARASSVPGVWVYTKLKASLSGVILKEGKPRPFMFGMLNGFLPCGLVYTALAASLVSETVLASATFMAAFGTGTSPLLSAFFFTQSLARVFGRFSFSKAIPYITVFISILMILRGLDLGIPMISPHIEPFSGQSSGCCPH